MTELTGRHVLRWALCILSLALLGAAAGARVGTWLMGAEHPEAGFVGFLYGIAIGGGGGAVAGAVLALRLDRAPSRRKG